MPKGDEFPCKGPSCLCKILFLFFFYMVWFWCTLFYVHCRTYIWRHF